MKKKQISDFLTSFSKSRTQTSSLYFSWIETPLGPMLAIAGETVLYLLEFVTRRGLEREITKLSTYAHSVIVPGRTPPLDLIANELEAYFQGKCSEFQTPYLTYGSAFQIQVWDALVQIPAGMTHSYASVAQTIGKTKAHRAVANANGANQLAIMIPCHRVINSNGKLGGYGGGIEKKEWLLKHEQTHYAF